MAVTSIGLDIGSSAVRAVQVTLGGRGPATLDRLGQVLLPVGAVRDGEIIDTGVVAEAVRTLWQRYGFKGRRVQLGLANQQVVVRQIDLPYLPDEELRRSLDFQAQDAIPIPVEQAILDFHTLEHFENEQGERFSRILLVAAQRVMVEGILEVVRAARLEPVGLDLDAFAMLRSLAPSGLLDERGGEMLIDVGASVTNIVVHEEGVPRFVRILLMGGGGITETLVSSLGLEQDEAEDVKARTGISDDYAIGTDGDAGALITERALRFVDEIRGSLDYYSAQTDAVPVRRAIISGGASQLPNLRERLSETLRMPVDRGHPMQELKIGSVGLASEQLIEAEPYLAVAIGLALGAGA
jgi:type IV pilus assembly protein PilM